MTLGGLDFDATRIRAVRGAATEVPDTVPLEQQRAELPMVISTERGSPEPGSPGLQILQERSDLVFANFLPQLGKTTNSRRWRPQSHSLDAHQAVKIVLYHLRRPVHGMSEIAVSLPPYLNQDQIELLLKEATDARLPVRGTIVSPLAGALVAYAENPWSGTVLMIDVDDHALWLSLLEEADGHARLVETLLYPKLCLGRWKNRLLNALADCCVLQSRRDPRDFPSAAQSLYMQLDGVMENCVQNRPADVTFQTSNWYQHLVLQPEETESFCAAFVRPVIADVRALFDNTWPQKPPSAILMSSNAAKLPGLAVALEECLDQWFYLVSRDDAGLSLDGEVEDFGAHLMEEEEVAEVEGPQVVILSAEATARGAHMIAAALQEGKIEPGHLSESAPLPEPQSAEAGPARLYFQGRDHMLTDHNFSLGHRQDCDLIFDRKRFPNVSSWHCEILYDPRNYRLKDHSREGTWVNDQPVNQVVMLSPGDQIRLGPGGPVIRYLGRPHSRGWTTIA